MPAAGVALTVADQCRVRDRSTIMARHLYADLGDEFADTQVCCSHVVRRMESLFPLIDRKVNQQIDEETGTSCKIMGHTCKDTHSHYDQ